MAEKNFHDLASYPYVRLRTEVYLGSREPTTQKFIVFDGKVLSVREITYVPALFTYFREILENSLDELIDHKGGTVRVLFDPKTLELEISDDGSGIPIEYDDRLKGIPAVKLLSKVQASSNFDEAELHRLGLIKGKAAKVGKTGKVKSTRTKRAGANGVGGSVVNFTSEYFKLDVWRQKKHFTQTWREGTDDFKTDGHKITPLTGPKTGTRAQFKPSAKVYKTLLLPEELIISHLHMLAAANRKRGVKFYYNDEPIKVKDSADPVVSHLFGNHEVITITVTEDIAAKRAAAKKDAEKKGKPVEDVDANELAATYYLIPKFSEDETVHSIVNNVPAFNGGTHIEAFRNAFYTEMLKGLATRMAKEKVKLKRSDLAESVLIFNVTSVIGPDFDAQAKSKLQNTNIVGDIKAGITTELVEKIIRNNKGWIDHIIALAKARQGKRADDEFEDTQKKMLRARVAKLLDATGQDRSKCWLFLGEGDSAVKGGLVSERDPKLHGVLPLRGKIKNAHDLSKQEIVDSEVYSDILKSLGLMVGKTAHRRDLRYGGCYFATDEDEDGKHIAALLVNFFYRGWPELFDPKQPAFFYKFCTPFFIARKGKENKYFYSHEMADFHAVEEKYSKANGWDITRAKGLGSLKIIDWQHSMTNVKAIPLIADNKMEETLDLLFNKKRAADRKEWLSRDE